MRNEYFLGFILGMVFGVAITSFVALYNIDCVKQDKYEEQVLLNSMCGPVFDTFVDAVNGHETKKNAKNSGHC